MNCEQVTNELSAYVDAALAPSMQAEVAKHLGSCAKCQKHLAELQKLAAGVAAMPRLQPAPVFLGQVRKKIAAGETSQPRTWREILFEPVWLKAPVEALALVAILAVVTVFTRPSTPRPASVAARPKFEADQVPAAGQDERELKARDFSADQVASQPGASGVLQQDAEDDESRVARALTVAKSVVPEIKPKEIDVRTPQMVIAGKEKEAVEGEIAEYRAAVTAKQQPAESVVVLQGDDAAQVRARVGELAALYRGRVQSARRDSSARQPLPDNSMIVELPLENVAAFKASLLGAMDGKPVAEEFVSEGLILQRAEKPGVGLAVRTAGAESRTADFASSKVGGKAMDAAPTETPATVFLEIRVLPIADQ